MSDDLHRRIMNINECDPGAEGNPLKAYKLGHRDARHAAAEIASEGDAVIADLLAALENIVNREYTYLDGMVMGGQLGADDIWSARDAITRAKGEA